MIWHLFAVTPRVIQLCPQNPDPNAVGVYEIQFGLCSEGLSMKKNRFTREQIAFALQQVEAGTPIIEKCRKMGA